MAEEADSNPEVDGMQMLKELEIREQRLKARARECYQPEQGATDNAKPPRGRSSASSSVYGIQTVSIARSEGGRRGMECGQPGLESEENALAAGKKTTNESKRRLNPWEISSSAVRKDKNAHPPATRTHRTRFTIRRGEVQPKSLKSALT